LSKEQSPIFALGETQENEEAEENFFQRAIQTAAFRWQEFKSYQEEQKTRH
jgi:hypothetical protein